MYIQQQVATKKQSKKSEISGVLSSSIDKTNTLITDSDEISAHTNRGGILPCGADPRLGKSRAMIAFDWVEFTGKKLDGFLKRNQTKYRLIAGASPVLWDVHVELDGTWQKCAVLWTELGAGIDKSWCKIKLDNKFCYQSGPALVETVKDLCYNLNITFKNYTRLDLACDVQKTDYRNFTMQDFINKVARREYIFKGGKKWKHRGEDGKVTIEDSEAPVTVEGRGNLVEYIRIGRRSSGLSIIIYNKTKEMKAKGEKPWIREGWKQAGFYDDIDTFRIEMSYMKSTSALVHIDKGTGEIVEIMQHEDINCLSQLDGMWRTLYNQHFVVAIKKKGVRFSRLKRVCLLTFEHTFFRKERICDMLKSNNYIKTNIRQTMNYAKDCEGDEIRASFAYELIYAMVQGYGLQKWFMEKFPGFDPWERTHVIDRALIMKVDSAYEFRLKQERAFFQTNTCRFN